MYIYIYIYIHTHLCIYVYIDTCVCVCVCEYACVHLCTPKYTHTYIEKLFSMCNALFMHLLIYMLYLHYIHGGGGIWGNSVPFSPTQRFDAREKTSTKSDILSCICMYLIIYSYVIYLICTRGKSVPLSPTQRVEARELCIYL